MTASQCNPSDDDSQEGQAGEASPNYLTSLTAGISPALVGLFQPHPLPERLQHLQVNDPIDARNAAAHLLAPLGDPAIDPDGHATLAALEIAAHYILLKTREQRARIFGNALNALKCEQDLQRLHTWRRLEWSESIRYDLHGLTGKARTTRLAFYTEANTLPEASIEAFAQIASSLDNIRTLDDCWMPEIP